MGESLMEGNGWFSGRVVRPPEVAVAMEREVSGRKKERRKKEGASPKTLCTRRALASLAPYCGPRAPARVASFCPPWRGRLPRDHPRAP
jgi:hypothetical protein